jgi:argininosuccinate lyase
VHNTPFGDIVDTEDDLQPLVATMFDDAARAVTLVAAAMASAEFNRERMAERARVGWITVTELADTLTREHGLPFKTSHAVAARFVGESARRPGEKPGVLLREITSSVTGRAVEIPDERLEEVLSPEYFVRVRTTPGGPSPVQTTAAIGSSRERLASDEEWMRKTVEKLRSADQRLKDTAAALK